MLCIFLIYKWPSSALCSSTHSELINEGSDVEPQRWLPTLNSAFQQQLVRLHQGTIHHYLLWENTPSVLQQTP